jgi:2'-5' RNA ligase
MTKREKRHQKVRPPDPHSLQASWRLFVAVPMPNQVRALVADLMNDLAAGDLPIRWIDPESAHLTLHFLGETPPERAELLRLALSAPVAKHQSFELSTGDLGVFPNARQPRVIWLGLDGDVDRLERLTRDVGRTLQQLGFPVEPGRFRPHITLGRVRDTPAPDLPANLERALRRASAARTTAVVPIEEVLLVRSFLGKGAPRHEPIARYPLRNQSS